jgi:hypothetical protein
LISFGLDHSFVCGVFRVNLNDFVLENFLEGFYQHSVRFFQSGSKSIMSFYIIDDNFGHALTYGK